MGDTEKDRWCFQLFNLEPCLGHPSLMFLPVFARFCWHVLVFAIRIFIKHPRASWCLLSGRPAAAMVSWLRVKVSIPCWPAQLAQLENSYLEF